MRNYSYTKENSTINWKCNFYTYFGTTINVYLYNINKQYMLFYKYKTCSHVRCMKIFMRFDIVWKSVVWKTDQWEILRWHKLWQPFTFLCSQLTYLQHLLRSNILHPVKIALHFLMTSFWLVIVYFCRAIVEVYGL